MTRGQDIHIEPRCDIEAQPIEGARKAAMERARTRLSITVILFSAAFLVLGLRAVNLGVFDAVDRPRFADRGAPQKILARGDIVDRNGLLLATNLVTHSLYADPKHVLDAKEASKKLVQVVPDLSLADVETRLNSSKRFVWIKRHLSPKEMYRVNALGLPGLNFQQEDKRVYPHGRLAAHVLGYVDVDGRGIAGVEHFFDARLVDPARSSEPLALSIDARVQHALADELSKAVSRHSAIGAAGIVLDVRTGEALALVSLPDFDPSAANLANSDHLFNRATKGVYELGSIFKPFTFASALETGTIRMASGYDATEPIRIARFLIRDDHPKKRYLTVPEIFAYSSNIGTAKMAVEMGTDAQRRFLSQFGLLSTPSIELTEVGAPIYPDRWGEISTMTISYGHGIAVSPLATASGLASIANGGVLNPATLVKKSADGKGTGKRVLSPRTSSNMRKLFRVAVTSGTGATADVAGYRIGGKTGTAEKPGAGGYQRKALVSSFVSIFPMDDPRYLVLAMLDEPKGTKETYGFASGSWVSGPVAREVVRRVAPMLGVMPGVEDERMYRQTALLIRDDEKY